MSASFTLETKEFQQAVRECLASTSRELSVAVNSRMFAIAVKAFKAMRPIDKAGRRKVVEAYLRAPPSKARVKWRIRRGNDFQPVSLANLLVQKLRGERGEKGLYGQELRKATESFIKTEKSRVGYLRSAFSGLAARFARFAQQPAPKGGRYRAMKQRHKAAQPGFNPVAEMNATASIASGQSGNVSREYEAALRVAMASELEEMKAHIAKKMQAVADRHNAR
jgi:hypothetical protein